jgi:hypothetical protein
MAADDSSQLSIETKVKGDNIRLVLDRGEQNLGTFLLSNQTDWIYLSLRPWTLRL